MLRHRSFGGFKITPEKDYLKSRKPVLVNSDCHLSLAAPAGDVQKERTQREANRLTHCETRHPIGMAALCEVPRPPDPA